PGTLSTAARAGRSGFPRRRRRRAWPAGLPRGSAGGGAGPPRRGAGRAAKPRAWSLDPSREPHPAGPEPFQVFEVTDRKPRPDRVEVDEEADRNRQPGEQDELAADLPDHPGPDLQIDHGTPDPGQHEGEGED